MSTGIATPVQQAEVGSPQSPEAPKLGKAAPETATEFLPCTQRWGRVPQHPCDSKTLVLLPWGTQETCIAFWKATWQHARRTSKNTPHPKCQKEADHGLTQGENQKQPTTPGEPVKKINRNNLAAETSTSHMEVLVTQLRLPLCDPVDCIPPGSSVHRILQARVLEWTAIPSSRGSSQPRD